MLEFGPYQLVQRLATGGMGEVFLARLRREEGFEKVMVIKRILPHLAEDLEFRDMFLNEARLAAALSHTNVAQVFDFGQIEGSYYLAMEYVHGTQVRSLLQRCHERRRPLAAEHAVQIALGCCHGLEHAHKRLGVDGSPMPVIHRDVSPRNILISFEGEVKLCDFGLARVASKDVTNPGQLKGKYSYMSPEHVRGEVLDSRSDLFSLGAVLYELLTGCQAFPLGKGVRETLTSLAQGIYTPISSSLGVPAGLEEVVTRALKPNPQDRFPDARSMASALQEASAELTGQMSSFGMADLLRELFSEEARAPLLADGPTTAVASHPIHSTSRDRLPGAKKTAPDTPAALWAGGDPGPGKEEVPDELRTTISVFDRSPMPAGWGRSVLMGGLSALAILAGALLWTASAPQPVGNLPAADGGRPVESLGAPRPRALPAAAASTVAGPEPGSAPNKSKGAGPAEKTVAEAAPPPAKTMAPPTPRPLPRASGRKGAAGTVPERRGAEAGGPTPSTKERPLPNGDGSASASAAVERPAKVAPGTIWVKVVPAVGEAFVWDGVAVQGSARRAFAPGKGTVLRIGKAGWQQTLRLEAQGPDQEHLLQLNAASQPWAELVLDGRSLGTTPITGVRLDPGMHRIAFSSRDGERRELSLGVQ